MFGFFTRQPEQHNEVANSSKRNSSLCLDSETQSTTFDDEQDDTICRDDTSYHNDDSNDEQSYDMGLFESEDCGEEYSYEEHDSMFSQNIEHTLSTMQFEKDTNEVLETTEAGLKELDKLVGGLMMKEEEQTAGFDMPEYSIRCVL